MNAKFGITSKPINSTQRSMTNTVTRDCKLKENCSRHDPVFLVQGLNKITKYNYCEWESGYYWIDDIIYVTTDLQEVHCHLDPLSTFRDDIANVKGLCVYSDEAHWQDEIDDIRFTPDVLAARVASYKTSQGSGSNLWAWDLTNSTVIVEAIATLADSTHTSGYKRYILTYRQFEKVCYNLNCSALDAGIGLIGGGTSYTWQNLTTQAGQDLGKLLCAFGGSGDWHDCIIKATWLPIDATSAYNNCSVTSSVMPVGAIDMLPIGSTNIRVANSPTAIWSMHNTLPKSDLYPDILDDLQFCRNPRWMSIQVKTPGGIQVISDPVLRDDSAWPLQIYTDFDLFTGEWKMQISTNSTKNTVVLAKFNGVASMNLTSYLTNNGTSQSWTSNIIGKAVALYAGGVAAGAAENAMAEGATAADKQAAMVSGKKATLMSNIPNMMKEFNGGSSTNSIVDYYCFGGDPKLGAMFVLFVWAPHAFQVSSPYDVYKDYCEEYGYPSHTYISPGDCTDNSYLQFSETFIHSCTGATSQDKQIINRFLNDGIIWRTTV